MNVSIRNGLAKPDGKSHYTEDRITCEMGGAEVEVRQVGEDLVVVIKIGLDHRVEMEAREAAIWLVVKPQL